jgi:integrase
MAVRICIHPHDLKPRLDRLASWPVPREEQAALRRFIGDLALGKVNRGHPVSEGRCLKYLDSLKVAFVFWKKSALRLAVADVERFEKALNSGMLKSRRGGVYSPATRADLRKLLRVYLRWRLGREKAEPLVGWLDTRDVFKTPDFLRESEVERLYRGCKSARERFLVAVLFDAGARATEFHNIRAEDIELPRSSQNHVRVALKQEYSKTKGRTISLYWKHSLEAVREFLDQRSAEGMRSDEPVFKDTYAAGRLFLARLGRRVLGRRVHYHLFRHSSATYYADKLNRQQLCIRYGWTFSSNMPDVYIARSGVDMEELDKKFTGTEVESLRHSLTRVEQASQLKDERIQQLEQNLATLQRDLSIVAEILKLNPSRQEIESAVRRRAASAFG